MRRVAVAVAVAALAGLAGAAHAGDDYFSLGLHVVAPDDGRNATAGVGGSVGWALPFGALWLEPRVLATVLESDVSGAGAASQAGAGLDLHLPFGAADGSQLFLLAGGGALYNDATPDTLDGGSSFVNAGLGWRSAAQAGGLRYRVELRGSQDSLDGGQTDLLLGLVVELREAAPVAIVAAPATTPRTVLIEAPPPIPDEDGDGIPDAEDQCAQTLSGAKVEKDGCVWQEQTVTLSNLQFASGSPQLTADIRMRLDAVVDFFANQPDVRMDIYGHTDAQGAEAYNQALSAARAASVRDYLAGKGIAARRLTSQGFGESKPIDDNATEAGRARNRRVELHIHARQPR